MSSASTANPSAPSSLTTEIYIMRHAESGNNARGVGEIRTCDPGLTELGAKQSMHACDFLLERWDQYKIKHVYISPMTRTLETARPLIRKLIKDKPDVTINIINTIFENGGVFDGERSWSDEKRINEFPNPKKDFSSSNTSRRRNGISLRRHLLVDDNDPNDPSIEELNCIKLISPEDDNNFLNFKENNFEDGWWKGGRENDNDYNKRTKLVGKWIKNMKENSLLITHGKFMDTLIHELLGIELVENTNDIKEIFLTGGVGLSNFLLDHQRNKLGIGFLNQPTINDQSLRTGHNSQGFKY